MWIAIVALAAAVVACVTGAVLYYREPRDYDDDDGYYEDDYFSDIQDAVNEDGAVGLDGQQKLWETGNMPVIIGGGDSIPPQHRAEYARLAAEYGDDPAKGVVDFRRYPQSQSKGGQVPEWTEPYVAKSPSGQAPEWTGSEWQHVDTSQHRVLYDEVPAPAPDSKFERPWWDDVPRENLEAALRLAQAPATEPAAPQLEQELAPLPEAPSVAPEPAWPAPPAGTKWSDHEVTSVSEDTITWSLRIADEATLWETQQAAERARWRGLNGLPDDTEAA